MPTDNALLTPNDGGLGCGVAVQDELGIKF